MDRIIIDELTEKIVGQFTRIFFKYDLMEKAPIDLGSLGKLHSSEIHTIEAIGKNYGNTVTTLCRYFGITKSAASQVVSRLCRKGFLSKDKLPDNAKEVVLSITEKGKQAFDFHESLNVAYAGELTQIREKYTHEEAALFVRMLADVEELFERFTGGLKR